MILRLLSFRSFLAYTLSLQMALMAPVRVWAKDEDTSLPGENAIQLAIAEIQNSSYGAPPQAKNVALIARQERWIWDDSGQKVIKTYDLGNVDISMPDQSFFDAKSQLEIEYDEAGKRLLVHRVKPVNGKNVKTDTHVWIDVTLTAPIYTDSHFIYLATTEGVRIIAMNLLKRDGFNGVVPALRVTRALPLETGFRIVKVNTLSRASAPRAFQELDGTESPMFYLDGDLALDIAKVDEKGNVLEVNPFRVAQDQAMDFALEEYLAVIALIQTRSPQTSDPKAMQAIQEFFDLYSKQLKEKNREIADLLTPVNAEHDDLLIEAVSSLAQRSGLQKHIKGFKEIVEYADRKRDRFASDPSPQGQWARDYKKILEVRERLAAETKAKDVPWDTILAGERMERLQSYVATQTRSEQTRRGRIFNAAANLWSKVSSPTGLKILAATLAGTYAAGVAGLPVADQIQIWMTSALSTMWNAITTSPASPADLKEALTSLPKFLHEGGSLGAWLAGGGVFCSAYFMLIGMVDAYKRVSTIWSGKSADKVGWLNSAKSLLVTMTKGYLIVNRVMELPWKLAKQNNLYDAMDHDIPLTQRGVFNLSRKDEKIAANTEKLNEYVKDRTLLNALATRFAAATLVAEKSEIDVATLFQEEKHLEEATATMVTTDDPALRTEYFELTAKVHAAAADILRDKDVKLDVEKLQYDYAFYDKIANKLKEQAAQNPSMARKIWDRLKTFSMTGARAGFIYLLGGTGRELYNKFYNASYSEEAVQIGIRQGTADFTASTLMWWGAAPAGFASFEGRIQAGVGEQLLSWTSQSLPDVAPSLVDGQDHADGRIGAQLNFARAQTLPEALSSILKGLFDPRSSDDKKFKDPLEIWEQYIVNLKDGLVVRLLFAAVPLYLLQFLPAAHSVTGAFTTAAAASFTTALYILGSKFAIRGVGAENNYSPGHAEAIAGYTIVWPIATSAASIPKAEVAQNEARLQKAVADIMEGVELNNLEEMQSGVRDLKGLYATSGFELPIELNVDSTKYDNEMANKLVGYSLKKVPVPTKENKLLDHIVNIGIGSFISMVLFNNLQEPLVHNNGAGLVDLAGIAGFLVASYAAVKATRTFVVQPAIKKIDQYVSKPLKNFVDNVVRPTCQSILGRDAVNTY